MATAFKAAHTATAADVAALPSVFDILAQQSQTQSLKPAIQYLLKFGNFFYRSKTYAGLLSWFDELYAAMMLAVENHFLQKYGASFSENFYSMKRSFGSQTFMSSKQRVRSLFFLVIMPYIEGKLNSFKDRIENMAPHLRTPFMNIFYKWYPIFCKILGFISLVFLVLYGFGYVEVQSLPLYLLGARLKRLTPEEIESSEKPVYNEGGVLGRATRIFLQVPSWTGRFFSYALFFKDIHEFMNNSNAENPQRAFNYEVDFARPVHPVNLISEEDVIRMDIDKCPLCHRRRENDTVLSVSGYVFCFPCINNFVRNQNCCPVTGLPASAEQLVRLYRK